MIRKIIRIDKNKCNGCSACAKACHEGAIEMIDGVAVLTREDYCDGLGDCLPACPTGAITFEEREAPAYNEAAVMAAKAGKADCPGGAVHTFTSDAMVSDVQFSRLKQWPVQIKLLPVTAPFYNNAHLLVAADCTAYAYGNFHNDFMTGKVTVVGCPKLDMVDYSAKLTQIIVLNNIAAITLTRMQVPCCGGMENAVKRAIAASGKNIPLNVVTISTNGKIL